MLKIFLAGPLPSKNSSGGVAVFTLNLAEELVHLGYEVIVFSNSKKQQVHRKYRIESIGSIRRISHQEHPDLIISSLWYSLFSIFVSNTIKVHLLHGFTNLKNYNYLKFWIMLLIDKLIRKKFTYILANSKFTKLINEEIFNLKVDGLYQIGLSNDEIRQLTTLDIKNKKKEILYVGRLIPAKNINLIIKNFLKIRSDSILRIIGYGPEEGALKKLANTDKTISFDGSKSHNEILKYYSDSKVFVSLNPVEPFGITYLEALLTNNFIIAPDTGGHVDLLRKFPNRVALVNINDSNAVQQAMLTSTNKELDNFSTQYDIQQFSYSRTVNDIFKVINSDSKKFKI